MANPGVWFYAPKLAPQMTSHLGCSHTHRPGKYFLFGTWNYISMNSPNEANGLNFFPRNHFVIWGDLFPWHGLNSTKPNEKQSRHQCSSRAQRKIISTDAWLNKWPSRSYVPTTSSITGNRAHTFALLFHCLKQTRLLPQLHAQVEIDDWPGSLIMVIAYL